MSRTGMTNHRLVLVSGGSGGIGSALCRMLREAGYRPVVAYSANEEAAVGVARACAGLALHLDLTDVRSIDAAVDRIQAELAAASLAGTVLAASPPPMLAPFTRIGDADFESQWRVNVAGPRRLLSALVKRCFAPAKAGTVVGVLTEAMGKTNDPSGQSAIPTAASTGMGSYIIAKYGQFGLLAVLAAEYPWLRVRAVSPGFTQTRMLTAFDPRFLERQARIRPFRTPDDVASEILQEFR
jgi:NAD(P)-dependent dehydrogenase (short-subunit alcohol dehydrogenase family)